MNIFPTERDLEPIDDSVEVSGTITVTFKFEDAVFPKHWTEDEIIAYITENYRDYMDKKIKVEDVDLF